MEQKMSVKELEGVSLEVGVLVARQGPMVRLETEANKEDVRRRGMVEQWEPAVGSGSPTNMEPVSRISC